MISLPGKVQGESKEMPVEVLVLGVVVVGVVTVVGVVVVVLVVVAVK